MTTQSPNPELQERVVEFQKLKALSTAEQHTPAVKKRLEHCTERIWLIMQEDLLELASQWLRSELGRDRMNHGDDAKLSLALIAFKAIFLRLQTIKIDPNKNLKALLFTIGRRGLYNENKPYLPHGLHPIESFDQGQSTSGVGKGSIWDAWDLHKQAYEAEDLADPNSFDWENRLIESFDMIKYKSAIQAAIGQLLEHEQVILSLRYSDPSVPYKNIAEMLDRKEAAIRQSCKRALQKIHRHLVDAGFAE